MTSIVLLCLLAVCLMSYFLICTDDYDSGIVGHLALAGLSFSSGVGFAQLLCNKIVFDPVSQIMFVSVAVFEARHIYRMYKGKTKSHDLFDLIGHICRSHQKY